MVKIGFGVLVFIAVLVLVGKQNTQALSVQGVELVKTLVAFFKTLIA
jgi:hypothetical protein